MFVILALLAAYWEPLQSNIDKKWKKIAIDSIFFIIKAYGEGNEINGIPPSFPFRSKTENDQKLRSNTLLPTENIDIAKCNYSPKSEFLGFPIGSYWIGDFFFLTRSYILFLSCTKIWKIFFLIPPPPTRSLFPIAVKVVVILLFYFLS